MERRQKILNLSHDFLTKKFEETKLKLDKHFSENKEEIINEFNLFINNLIEKSKNKPVTYLQICYLRSSSITESLEFKISFHNEKFYLDTQETYSYWQPSFLFIYLNEGMEEFKKHCLVTPKLTIFELKEVKQMYINFHYSHMANYMKELCENLKENLISQNLNITENFQILYGGHMENGVIISSQDENFKEKAIEKVEG